MASLLEAGAGAGHDSLYFQEQDPRVLAAVSEVPVPGGLFYVGIWGGADEEGPMRDDRHPVTSSRSCLKGRPLTPIVAETLLPKGRDGAGR